MDELPFEEAMAFIARSDVAHLGVIDNGAPYVSPISYVLIEGRLCFRTGAGRRLDALRSNPRVSVEVSQCCSWFNPGRFGDRVDPDCRHGR